jgi:hypothetical protein
MRSRPATWTALVWRSVLQPCSTHEAWGSSSLMRSEERLLRCTRQIAAAKRTSQADLQHHGGRRPVLPYGGLCEEAATPGQPSACRSTLWRNPPSHSPSRIAGHRRLCRNALAGHAEHLARCQTLCASHAFTSSKNPSRVVQKLWMPAIPCGSAWKMRDTLISDLVSVAAPRPPASMRKPSTRDPETNS